ncbi:MAG: hypothetical protein MHM6MM_005622 [Cercozoa sp. M6MM]
MSTNEPICLVFLVWLCYAHLFAGRLQEDMVPALTRELLCTPPVTPPSSNSSDSCVSLDALCSLDPGQVSFHSSALCDWMENVGNSLQWHAETTQHALLLFDEMLCQRRHRSRVPSSEVHTSMLAKRRRVSQNCNGEGDSCKRPKRQLPFFKDNSRDARLQRKRERHERRKLRAEARARRRLRREAYIDDMLRRAERELALAQYRLNRRHLPASELLEVSAVVSAKLHERVAPAVPARDPLATLHSETALLSRCRWRTMSALPSYYVTYLRQRMEIPVHLHRPMCGSTKCNTKCGNDTAGTGVRESDSQYAAPMDHRAPRAKFTLAPAVALKQRQQQEERRRQLQQQRQLQQDESLVCTPMHTKHDTRLQSTEASADSGTAEQCLCQAAAHVFCTALMLTGTTVRPAALALAALAATLQLCSPCCSPNWRVAAALLRLSEGEALCCARLLRRVSEHSRVLTRLSGMLHHKLLQVHSACVRAADLIELCSFVFSL